MDEFCEEQQHPLLALPEFLFEKIVLYLHIRDVLQLGLVCRALHERTNNEHLWQDFCQKHWGNCTQVERWLRVPDDGNYVAVDPPSGSAFRGFRSYKSLFKFLSSMEALLGVWRSESTSRGCLYVFSWQSDCISGREVSYDSMVKLPLSAPFVQIGPSSRANAQLIGNACILKKISFPSKASSSAAAEAVAAVAIGPYRSVSPLEIVTCSSALVHWQPAFHPPGSPLQTTYRLIRVDRAVPSKRHSLSGLWKGKYGGETPIQVIHITYDFTGPCAKIHALKVTGDRFIPAGERTFWAQASPLKEPRNARDTALVNMRWLLLGEDDHLRGSQSEQSAHEAKEVAACFRGKGHCAGAPGESSGWVDGRLWQYTDGDIGFLWLDNVDRLVDFKRIDADLS